MLLLECMLAVRVEYTKLSREERVSGKRSKFCKSVYCASGINICASMLKFSRRIGSGRDYSKAFQRMCLGSADSIVAPLSLRCWDQWFLGDSVRAELGLFASFLGWKR